MTYSTFAEGKDYSNNTIRKKAYRISEKTIIIIDESLVRRLSIDDNTWFIEEEREDGVLLRITKKV